MVESNDWVEYSAKDGRKYYYNKATKKTTWEKPDELKTKEEKATPWKEYVAKGGRKYWHNTVTKETTWDMPDELKKGPQQPAQPQKPVLPTKTNFATKEEAEDAFMKMLEAEGVESNWEWEQTMRAVINHPLYRCLKTLSERKEAFGKYITQKKAIEEKEYLAKAKERREKFYEMLNEVTITEYTRYNKVAKLKADHPAMNAVTDLKERLEFFEDYMGDYHEKIKERRQKSFELIKQATESILLDLPNIQVGTRWDDVKKHLFEADEIKKLVDDAKVNNPVEEYFAKISILKAFAMSMERLDKEDYEKRREAEKQNYRKERVNRDNYRELLREHLSAGNIAPVTTWAEFYPLVKSDLRYTNILGQKGSSPLEMFWDEVELLNEEVYDCRKRLESDLKAAGIRISHTESLDGLKEILKSSRIKVQIPDNVLPYVHEQLIIKAQRKYQDEVDRKERHKKRLLDDFKYELRDLSPPLTPESTWEDEKKRISKMKIYREIDDEDSAMLIFTKVIDRIKESSRRKHSRSEPRTSEHRSSSKRPKSGENKEPLDEEKSDCQMEEGEEPQ
ncbi:U1 snRNP protein [Mycoemilia scoparia]|uniref:U1 snRNP protein n=1 Tax=Mycoemilia scoparia TaxID=417184 RepID=A0A9W8A7N3_9FUNG|nr:U1 snRNP protein [Mycoemilia scoparia]